MKKSGNDNLIKLAAFLKRNAMSLLAVLMALVTMVTGTSAWLERSGLVKILHGSGFHYQNNLEIMRLEYAVETFFKDNNGVWQLITKDYLRAEDKAINWTVEWDQHCPALTPGKRTEFRTVITNLTKHEQKAMVHLLDVAVEKEIADRITVAAIEPEVLLYSSADEALFQDSSDRKWVESHLLCLAPEIVIPVGESRSIEWYVLADGETACGGFPVLTDTAGKPIPAPDGGFYAINKTDADGHVTEAFECDAQGVLRLKQGQLITYPGDYSTVQGDYYLTGYSPRRVRISGMIIAVG